MILAGAPAGLQPKRVSLRTKRSRIIIMFAAHGGGSIMRSREAICSVSV